MSVHGNPMFQQLKTNDASGFFKQHHEPEPTINAQRCEAARGRGAF
jgi:hypothetical protein